MTSVNDLVDEALGELEEAVTMLAAVQEADDREDKINHLKEARREVLVAAATLDMVYERVVYQQEEGS